MHWESWAPLDVLWAEGFSSFVMLALHWVDPIDLALFLLRTVEV